MCGSVRREISHPTTVLRRAMETICTAKYTLVVVVVVIVVVAAWRGKRNAR